MKEIILIKEGEIFLKGQNKKDFEAILKKNIKKSLYGLGQFKLTKEESTITIEFENSQNIDKALNKLYKIFGIASFSKTLATEKNFEEIKKQTKIYFNDELNNSKTFKVVSKRSDKNFPLSSFEICCKMGEFLLNCFPNLKVDVKNPETTINIEIKDYFCYIYIDKKNGAKGLPVGTSGTGLLLLSGGIDSPVAGYMMAKRGLNLQAVHFISPPYTGKRALQKVETIGVKLSEWVYNLPIHIVNVTEIQEQIKKYCPENLLTIILRREMMRIAENIIYEQENKGYNIKCIITGESLGQVASQTVGAINCTNSVCSFPIFRPLIGLDKEEIISIARKIETYETSILPYEDCCSIFSPPHPKTNPKIDDIYKAEEKLNLLSLTKQAMLTKSFKILH